MNPWSLNFEKLKASGLPLPFCSWTNVSYAQSAVVIVLVLSSRIVQSVLMPADKMNLNESIFFNIEK